MTNFDEFRKENGPAHGESEREYFLRLTNKYRSLHKIEKRKLLLKRLTLQLSSIAKRLIAIPHLRHIKPV